MEKYLKPPSSLANQNMQPAATSHKDDHHFHKPIPRQAHRRHTRRSASRETMEQTVPPQADHANPNHKLRSQDAIAHHPQRSPSPVKAHVPVQSPAASVSPHKQPAVATTWIPLYKEETRKDDRATESTLAAATLRIAPEREEKPANPTGGPPPCSSAIPNPGHR